MTRRNKVPAICCPATRQDKRTLVELLEQEEVVQAPRKPVHEFDPPEDEPEDDAKRAQTLRRGERGLARQVSLDPGDRMGL